MNPATGGRQLALISEAQEIQMGRQAAQEVALRIGLVQDDCSPPASGSTASRR